MHAKFIAVAYTVAFLAVFALADKKVSLSKDEIRKYVEEDYEAANKNVKKTVEDGVKVYAHVHHSPATESDKLDAKKRKSLLSYDIEGERYDQLKNTDVEDADVVAMELKYEKVFSELLKEIGLKNARQLTPRTLLFEVEKRMETKDEEQRVKPFDRMLSYLKHQIMEVNKFNEDGEEDKYDMKKFVSNVFGKYRARHEEDKSRVQRILDLEEHLYNSGEHDPNERRDEFHDKFYVPREYRTNIKQPILDIKGKGNL